MRLKDVVKRLLQVVLLIVSGILLGIVVLNYSDADWAKYLRWVGLLFFTLIVFGTAVREFRSSWKRITFWLYVSGLLVVHVATYAVVLNTVEGWRYIWFVPLSVAECPVLMFVLHLLGYNERPISPHRPLEADKPHGAHERAVRDE